MYFVCVCVFFNKFFASCSLPWLLQCKMNFKEFTADLATYSGSFSYEMNIFLRALFIYIIEETLVKLNYIHIAGLGTFSPEIWMQRLFKGSIASKPIQLQDKVRMKFVPSKKIREFAAIAKNIVSNKLSKINMTEGSL